MAGRAGRGPGRGKGAVPGCRAAGPPVGGPPPPPQEGGGVWGWGRLQGRGPGGRAAGAAALGAPAGLRRPPSSSGACSRRRAARRAGRGSGGDGAGASGAARAGVSRPRRPLVCTVRVSGRPSAGECAAGAAGAGSVERLQKPLGARAIGPRGVMCPPSDVNGGNGGGRRGFSLSQAESAAGRGRWGPRRGPTGGGGPSGERAAAGAPLQASARAPQGCEEWAGDSGAGRVTSRQPRPPGGQACAEPRDLTSGGPVAGPAPHPPHPGTQIRNVIARDVIADGQAQHKAERELHWKPLSGMNYSITPERQL
ncbi:spidroin-1-like [Manis pentadactyla]|uniref:spidroin-1-like n=1 Tax=Manis pentadactyla TaxID=143292 RepID=UPI00255C3C5A|nr:spidroin-1-like [Manis pentadactyla]